MTPFNVRTKSNNSIIIFDPNFANKDDDFQILFVSRTGCFQKIIDIESVTECEGRISFNFSLVCELQSGIHDATLNNISKSTVVFSDCIVNVFDTPQECVNNPL